MKLPKKAADAVVDIVKSVVVDENPKAETVLPDGWKVKGYKVGTYFRVDIFPPSHGGK